MAASVDTVEAEAVTATTTTAIVIETDQAPAPIPTATAQDHDIDVAPSLTVGPAETIPSQKQIYPTNFEKSSILPECRTEKTRNAES
jgi:hypothetical protein